MQQQDELFSGERLELARDFRGLTQTELGRQVAASAALISACENGKKPNPADDLVAAFGEVLGFEKHFFFNSLEDAFLEEECSFRHRRSTPQKLKAQIRAHGTLLGMVVQELRKHFVLPDLDLPRFPSVTDPDDIEHAAEGTRKHWELSLDAPIWSMGRLMERSGVMVVRHLVKSSKVDAFSREGQTTVIFLNDAIQSSSRWNFDIGHEAGHLIMHRGIHTGDLTTEAQADRFASAFLMPRVAFTREFSSSAFTWKHVFDLKRRWHASAAAIVRRAFDLNLIGPAQYRRSYQYMSFKGWTKLEPAEPNFQEPELLSTALKGLGIAVPVTAQEICSNLKLTPATFTDITGVEVSVPAPRRAAVLPFELGRGF